MKKQTNRNPRFWIYILAVIPVLFCQCGKAQHQEQPVEQLINEYIAQWQQFYPTQAVAAGDKTSAFAFENFSPSHIDRWNQFNTTALKKLDALGPLESLSWDDRVDLQLLRRFIQMEQEKWQQERLQENSPVLYAELISQALTDILARGILNPEETARAIICRLEGIDSLCDTAITALKNGTPYRTQSCPDQLESSAAFYETGLPGIATKLSFFNAEETGNFLNKTRGTAAKIRELAAHIKDRVIPNLTLPDTLGEETYSRKLKLYAGPSLSPRLLERISLEEVNQVLRMISHEAEEYWNANHPSMGKPVEIKVALEYALNAMENHRVDNQQEFLANFIDLIKRIEGFIRQSNLVTLPAKQTLSTALSPAHFAGAAVGGVYPAGPFNPEADTLFYLPTVPDTAPQEVKDGFYRSFNNHFNTMIISHEIMPGHYLQLKLAAANHHPVRSLYPDDLFVEGWASLCEQITLDAGWDGDNPLTRLAHLRKRLENAVRAYTSVQVHCNGWDRDKVITFAVERGLLAPQFAVNLWDRLMNSPLQLTSYFLGFRGFTSLLAEEKKRKGEDFKMKSFCDRILKAGAVPMDELQMIFL